jgi:hypothetical protein
LIEVFGFGAGKSDTGILSEGGRGSGEFGFLAVRIGVLGVEFGLELIV